MELRKDSYDIVLIIGNGFDLNLRLKTGYCDFVESIYFEDLIKQENQLSIYLSEQYSLQNWIDIENELKVYSKKVESTDNNFFKEFKDLSNKLKQYLKTIDYKSLDKESIAYRLIEKNKNSNLLIVDFNYTLTIQNIFNDLGVDSKSEFSNIEHIKIHGSFEENDDIIFGVEDNAHISPKHVFLKKSVNINFNDTDFSKAMSDADTFVVFGHSLGETDHMYFKDFFTNISRQNTKGGNQNIIVFYHGEESYFNIFAQLDELTIKSISKFKKRSNFKAIDTKNYG